MIDCWAKAWSSPFPGSVNLALLEVIQKVFRTGQPEHHPISFYEDNKITGWREKLYFQAAFR